MFSLYLQCDEEERDALITELWERGTLGIVELASGVRAWFEDGTAVADLVASYDGDIQPEPERDWVAITEASFPARAVGERFWLVPPWNEEPVPSGRLRLEINPGLACGTGWHPCTQLCLEALERRMPPGADVLDVGVGSGILTLASRLLGARNVIACDLDPDAIAIARERIGEAVFVGSADAVCARAFDVVVANISAEVITAMWDDLGRVLRPGGLLIASGFREIGPLDGVVEETERDGWHCVVAH